MPSGDQIKQTSTIEDMSIESPLVVTRSRVCPQVIGGPNNVLDDVHRAQKDE